MTAPTLTNVQHLLEQRLALFAAQDWEHYRAFLAEDAVYDEPCTGTVAKGPDAIVGALKAWKQSFPDLAAKVDRVIVSGTSIAAELTWTGTHSGALHFGGKVYEPTGITATTRAVQIIELRGDKVAVIRNYLDLATILARIGVIPR